MDFMRKRAVFIFIISLILLFQGCKKKDGDSNDYNQGDKNIDITGVPEVSIIPDEPTPTAAAQESLEGKVRSKITGLWVAEEVGNKRPYAIQFNNYKSVSNQWGIGQADILYEALVEGGITRLLAIGENFTGNKIGSIRSSRHYFVSIADEYDAIYVHYGKTKYAKAKIQETKIDNLDGEAGIGSTVFYRDKSLKAPNNAFTSLEGILAGIKSKKYDTEYDDGYEAHFTFYQEDTDLASDKIANKVTIDFSGYNTPYFIYNTEDRSYYRFQFGAPHIDSNTKEQLNFKNIIIQFVKEWDIDKNGYQTMDLEDASGEGYYISNGKMVSITWKKKEKSRWMRYYDENGQELSINPGKTFIALFPNNRTNKVKIENE